MDGQVRERLWAEARYLADRTPNAALDLDRLYYTYKFGPASIYVGRFERQGQFALVFPNVNRVLIDVPLVGRAAYLYGLASPSPSGISADSSLQGLKQITRICHIGDWKRRLKKLLGLKPVRAPRPRFKAPRRSA